MTGMPFDIAFITDGEAFHGASPEEQALGGSETALVQVARALARLGHRVRVFCRCPQPGEYHGVIYQDRLDLVEAATKERFEVLVVSRFFTAFDLPLQAGLKVLWNHDILDKPRLMADRLEQIDLAFVLSRYHAANYIERLPACEPKLALTRNGLDLALMDQAARGAAKIPGRVTYASRPERGLKDLLRHIWPRLKQALPHLELKLCGYQVDATSLHPSLQREYDEIKELVQSAAGVEELGALPKAQYYAHLASCEAMLYPCVFPEISCISALEAQALGTAIITSNEFALSETVQEDFFKVSGKPGSPAYLEAFTQRAQQYLSAPQEHGHITRRAQQKVRAHYSWPAIAAEWAALFERMLDERLKLNPAPLAASLLLEGASQAAAHHLGAAIRLPHEGPAPPDPEEQALNQEIAQLVKRAIGQTGAPARIGLLSSGPGPSRAALQESLQDSILDELSPGQPVSAPYNLVIIRDRLEREAAPERLLEWVRSILQPQGWLLLCIAHGAWPMLSPGYLARQHSLGPKEIKALLPGRELICNYLPRSLVRTSTNQYAVGRWLILAPAAGPDPKPLDFTYQHRQTRPAPPEVLDDLRRAGLLKGATHE
jgi:glycosyltransferase involved in cell wall biosynthesis